MAKFDIFKAYNNLPRPIQSSIALVGLFIVGYGSYVLIKKYNQSGKSDEGVQNAEKDAKSLQSQGLKPTYSDSEYSNFADTIHQAADGVGTDGAAILDVFKKMKNKLDVIKLITIYGKRQNTMFGVGKEQSLSATLSDEGVLEDVNKQLAKQGINYSL